MGHEGAGVRHRDGRGGRRGDVRDVPVDVRLAERDATRLLRAAAVRARLRLTQARTAAGGGGDRRHPGRVSDGDARRLRRHTRSREPRRAGGCATGVDSRRSHGRGSTTSSCDEAAGSIRTARTKSWRAKASSSPTNSNWATRCRRSSMADCGGSPSSAWRSRPSTSTASGRVSSSPTISDYGIFWMDEKALAAAFDMEGGFNDVVLMLSPGASSEEVIAQARSHPRTVRRTGRHPARAAAVALDRRERDGPAPELRVHAAVDLPHRCLVHPERGADARARAAEAADRLAEGAGIRQRRYRLALPEVGLRDRR